MAEQDHDSTKVWRYMSFARFVWLLQRKALWLSRVDLLGDPWEFSLSGEQLEYILPKVQDGTELTTRGAIERGRREIFPRRRTASEAQRVIENWRQMTYVSCWSGCEHESHALWRIYCPSVEGVAIQTTLTQLRQSLPSVDIHRVFYRESGSLRQEPTPTQLATEKRLMFSYEQEVRLLLKLSEVAKHILAGPLGAPDGIAVEWRPEPDLEAVVVHPDADRSFFDTVVMTVEQ